MRSPGHANLVPRRPGSELAFFGLVGLVAGVLARLADSQQWSREISSYLGLWWTLIVITSIAVTARHEALPSRPTAHVHAAASSVLILATALAAYYINGGVAIITIVFWVLITVFVVPVISMIASLAWRSPNQSWSPVVAGVLGATPIAEALSIATDSQSSSRWGAVWFGVAAGLLLCAAFLARTSLRVRTLVVMAVIVALGPPLFDLYAEIYRRFGSL